MSRTIKILFLAANPSDTHRLRLDEEIRAIDEALLKAKFRDRFDIRQHWAVRIADLQACLLRHEPDIVHFSGHGSKSSEIVLEDSSGNSHPVSRRALSQLFSMLRGNIRCVVLNACYSELQAQAIAEYVDCVIGMSREIGDRAAISFAAAFYQALGYGKDVKTAFDLGCIQVDLENLDEQDTPKFLTTKSNPVVFIEALASVASKEQMELAAGPKGKKLIVLDAGHNLYKWDRGSLPRLTAEYRLLASTTAVERYLVKEQDLGDFSLNILEGTELVILVNPRDCYYSQTEIDHLVQFIHSGGSLLILAYYWWKSDHDSNIGALVAEFGIHLRDDRIYDPEHYAENEYRPLCLCLTRELTDKPIVVPFCCSMKIDDYVEPLLVTSSSAKSEKVRLIDRRIVRQYEPTIAGPFITSARVKVKEEGNVIVLGSWEIFLDQIVNKPELGNQEFMKGVLTWLTKG